MSQDGLREVAAIQHGVVLAADLRRCALSRRQVRSWQSQGWLVEIRPGAYLLGGGQPSPWQKLVATWLLAGPSAVVSHATAGRIHRLFGVAPPSGRGDGIELTIPHSSRRRPGGCVVHRYAALPPDQVMGHRGIRVTTPARTLVDLLPRLPLSVVEKAVDEGAVSRLWTPADLMKLVEVSGGRPGIDVLRRLVAVRTGRSDSPLEIRTARALASFAPFETQYQLVLDGKVFLLDLAWPRYRVAAECEGWDVRSRSRSKFDHERRRDNLLASHGWTVIRLTSAMSDDEMRAAVLGVLLLAAGR